MTEAEITQILASLMEITSESDMARDAKIMECISIVCDRLNDLRMEMYKNISFFKAVLIQSRLTTEEAYKVYTDEWVRLNKHLFETSSSKNSQSETCT